MTHVLVTGAASGIGKEIATRFVARGDAVTLVDFDAVRLAEAVSRLKETASDPEGIRSITADLRDPLSPAAVMGEAFGDADTGSSMLPVDVLVNAAGVYPAVPFLDVTADIWDAVQAINVRAPMLLTVEFAKRVAPNATSRPTGLPAVVNISSGAALRARPGAAPYTTSKAAIEMVTKASALELGPLGIRVNAVAPGFVEVDSTVNTLTDDYVAKVSRNPLGRTGTPADIAKAVLWVASEEAEWVTGTVIRVDGGASAGAPDLPVHWHAPRTEVDA